MRKTTMNIDEQLLAEARRECGASTDVETVHLGLKALVRSAAYQRMRSLLGTGTGPVEDVPRRREAAKPKSRARRSA